MRTDITPEQKIKWLILQVAARWSGDQTADYPDATGPQIDEDYSALVDEDGHWDAKEEVRGSGTATGLPYEPCRHLEAIAVAQQLPDESWVGWTHYYGGGKHAEPGAVEWFDTAHNVVCVPTHMIVNVFTRHIEPAAEGAQA